ncbi:MAG: JDVT-CTERM system glutamic-type intramembrane protease, partial [Gammaproteobacteria bacterium]
IANVATTLLFAGFHFFYHAPLWAALVILPSLIFGYFRDRHQRVLPAIVLHVFYNAGYFWLFPP